MEYWKFLHILSMFSAVTLFVGISLLAERVIHAGDVRAIRRVGTAMKPLENAGIVSIVSGVVFGVVTAIVGSFDLTQTWLVIAYVLVAVLFVLGPIESVMLKRVFDAAERAPDGTPTPELTAAIDNPTRSVLTWTSVLLYVVVIFDMVTKPFA